MYRIIQNELKEKYYNEYLDEVYTEKSYFTSKDIEDCKNKADIKVYKELGSFEKTNEFKKIKNDFRQIGCKLSIGWE